MPKLQGQKLDCITAPAEEDAHVVERFSLSRTASCFGITSFQACNASSRRFETLCKSRMNTNPF